MRIPRIYSGQPMHTGNVLTLEPGPSAHIARALRMGPGDSLRLFNGDGGEFIARVEAVGKKTVQVLLGEHRAIECESPLAVSLGIAVSRGERMDLVIQKATELGVQDITPLFSERTEVRLKGERAQKKRLHWQQIAISACEQCGRNRVPIVNALQALPNWVDTVEAQRKLVLHHRDTPIATGTTPASVALLVGPEGGLTEGEIEAAQRCGFESLSLGPRVLRTETAPLAALAIVQAHWGDMALLG